MAVVEEARRSRRCFSSSHFLAGSKMDPSGGAMSRRMMGMEERTLVVMTAFLSSRSYFCQRRNAKICEVEIGSCSTMSARTDHKTCCDGLPINGSFISKILVY